MSHRTPIKIASGVVGSALLMFGATAAFGAQVDGSDKKGPDATGATHEVSGGALSSHVFDPEADQYTQVANDYAHY